MNIREWHDRINWQREHTRRFYEHWRGKSPAAWLSKESRKTLDDKLTRVGTNFPRLVVGSLVERLTLRGFRGADGKLDGDAWETFAAARGLSITDMVHTDYALYGCSYVTAALDEYGLPILLADSPRTASTLTESGTGRVASAVRTWRDVDGYARAVILDPVARTEFKAATRGGLDEVSTWRRVGETPNVLGVTPVVPFARRQSADDVLGTSVCADILDLTDANSKALGDAMVMSEMYAKPRRWATGLEINEDEDGNPIDPFGPSRLMQSEDPETKFGQLSASAPTGQTELVSVLTQQIGALTGLPPHYLGLHGDQPASAEGVRAAETQLVSRAQQEQDNLGPSWARVATLAAALNKMEPVKPGAQLRTLWRPAETKTPAQSADAAQKLRAIGVPLESLLSDPLDYAPEDTAKIVAAADREAMLKALGANNG